MNTHYYSAKEILEIKGSMIYFLSLVFMDIIASIFQFLAGVSTLIILKSFIPYAFCAYLAFVIYRRKKQRKSTTFLSWFIAFLTTSLIVYARYNYALNIEWQYAAEAIHMYGIAIVTLVLLQFLYNRAIYLTFFVVTVFNWLLFLYLAHLHGVPMPFDGIVNGQAVHGVLISREIYFILMMVIVGYISYRTIPVIQEFDRMTSSQHTLIVDQARQQREMATRVTEKMEALFSRVEEQTSEISSFNQKLQSQAATFEEISATIEELTGTSEKISEVAERQVAGNGEMEYTMREFFEIKNHTKDKLSDSLENIDHVLARTNVGGEILDRVEKTIYEISGLSDRIRETISVVVEIADKINMLSLNASIEAARAGEHGRGFAVVANEIGKLATQTAESIKEIDVVLNQNTSQTESGVKIIKDAAENIKAMINEMRQSSEKINDLRDNIFLEEKFLQGIDRQMKTNVQLAKETGTGTEEQKTALEATTKAIENLNLEVTCMAESINTISQAALTISEDASSLIEMARQTVTRIREQDFNA